MTPLPAALNPGSANSTLDVWRLDAARHAATWHQGEGAFLVGGRWTPRGRRVLYCGLDPSTSILEVAVHKSFRVLDTVAHKLIRIEISRPGLVHRLDLTTISNPAWLRSGTVSAGQQAFGESGFTLHLAVLVVGLHGAIGLPVLIGDFHLGLARRVQLPDGTRGLPVGERGFELHRAVRMQITQRAGGLVVLVGALLGQLAGFVVGLERTLRTPWL